jgi:hypothetical protein
MGFLAWGIFGGYGITSVTFMVIFTIVALIMTVFGIITQISVVRSAWKIAENSIRYLKKT